VGHMEHGLCPEWMPSLFLRCGLLPPPPPHPQVDLSTARAESAALSNQLLDAEAALTSQRVRTQSALPGTFRSSAVQVASPPPSACMRWFVARESRVVGGGG
jgi:hypothetical protein